MAEEDVLPLPDRRRLTLLRVGAGVCNIVRSHPHQLVVILVPRALESLAPVAVADRSVLQESLVVLDSGLAPDPVKFEYVVVEFALGAEHAVELAPEQNPRLAVEAG